MRVAMLTSQFLPEVFGGAEQQCLRLSKALIRQGVQVDILSSRTDPATPERELMEGVAVTRFYTPAPPQLGGRHLRATLTWGRKVGDWARAQGDLDVIHCHQAKLNAWIGARIARHLNIPMIVKPGSAGRNLDFLSLERKRFFYGTLAARQVVRDAATVVAISEEMLRDCRAYGIPEQKLVHIPNGAVLPGSLTSRNQAREKLGLPKSGRLLLFVGRLEEQKNVATLIRAHRDLSADTHLVVLGDGARSAVLKDLADDRVIFAGRVNDVQPYLAAADLFVLPAHAEGMSNALLEAMAAGLPSVVSAVSGNTDLIEDGKTGWLYGPPTDQAALTKALCAALALPPDELRAVGQAAATHIAKTYSIDQIAAQYVALYGRLTAARKAAAA